MNISRKKLIENAGIFKEGSTDRDAIAHFVWSQDAFMDKSEDEIEGVIDDLEKEYNASKSNYSNVDDYIEELEQGGGLDGLMNEAIKPEMVSGTASEILSLLAHPDIKKQMDALSRLLDNQQFMAIKKLYDGLYMELKKHE